MSGYLRYDIRRNAKVAVTLLPSGKTYHMASGSRLLEVLQLSGGEIVPCSGPPHCGVCHVRVVAGGKGLSKLGQYERDWLAQSGMPAESLSRLSCMATVGVREVTVELVNH